MQLKLDTAPAREQEQEPEPEHRGHGDNLAAKLGIVKLGKVAGKVGGQMACSQCSLSVGLYSVDIYTSQYLHPHTHLTDKFKIPMIHWKLSGTKHAMEILIGV